MKQPPPISLILPKVGPFYNSRSGTMVAFSPSITFPSIRSPRPPDVVPDARTTTTATGALLFLVLVVFSLVVQVANQCYFPMPTSSEWCALGRRRAPVSIAKVWQGVRKPQLHAEGYLAMSNFRLFSKSVHMPLHNLRQKVSRRLLRLARVHSPIGRVHNNAIPRHVEAGIKGTNVAHTYIRRAACRPLVGTFTLSPGGRHDHKLLPRRRKAPVVRPPGCHFLHQDTG